MARIRTEEEKEAARQAAKQAKKDQWLREQEEKLSLIHISISTNIVANVLGLGWAATPAGLKAMEDLAQLEEKRRQTGYPKNVPKDTASNEMCTFLILNISSLQLIPVNMIAYRSQDGSASPAAVVGPAVLATLVSTFAAVIFCRGMDRR